MRAESPPSRSSKELRDKAAAATAAAASAAGSKKKSSSSRREELLNQLKAVESAIAKKRQKVV